MSDQPRQAPVAGGRAPHQPAARRVPRQRDRRRGDVIVAVVSGPDYVNVVLAGAKFASDSEQALALVVFADRGRSPRSSMVMADGALTVARTAFPLLEVRVALGLRDEPGWEDLVSGRVTQVVVGPPVSAHPRVRDRHVPVTLIE